MTNALQMDKRERMGLIIGVTAVAVVVLLALYVPSGPKRAHAEAEARFAQLQQELMLTEILREEEEDRLRSQQRLMERLENRPANFDLFSFLNNVLAEHDLMARAQLENYPSRRMTGGQTAVVLRLDGVSLEELLNLLHHVYASENLVVMYKLDVLRPARNNQGLDCDVTFMTIKP